MFTGLILSGLLAVATQELSLLGPAKPVPPEKPDPAFSGLFSTQTPGDRQPRPAEPKRGASPRTKVVCGMTLLLVGPQTDPAMPKPSPKDHVTYTMRRYPPPACGDDHR